MLRDSVELKIRLLSEGISYNEEFLSQYSRSSEWIEKRRAYGSGDRVLTAARVPQEAILEDGIVCALNHCPSSTWALRLEGTHAYVCRGNVRHRIDFPTRPRCYGIQLSDGSALERVATVYGNTTLGIFTPGHCYYFNDNLQCRFCSLGPARDTVSDHLMSIDPQIAAECVTRAVKADPGRYRHVLINGGNLRDYDRAFARQIRVHQAISRLGLPAEIERHLISMPPKDLSMFEDFAECGGTLAMSLEIFDSKLFDAICPGKSQHYGRDRFIDAFRKAVRVIGFGNVYAGFVAGLEPLESLTDGMEFFADMGIVPAIAVFHPDANSQLVDHPRPAVEFLQAVGEKLAKIYAKHGFRPFIENSGRNAIDTEAYRQGFQ